MSTDPADGGGGLQDTPRVEIAPGLLEAKHRRALGPAWHLYLNLLRRKPFGTPWVMGGRLVTIPVLALIEDTGEREVQRWVRRLEAHGYIRVERIAYGKVIGRGMRIRILKAKDWRRGRLRVIPDAGTGVG